MNKQEILEILGLAETHNKEAMYYIMKAAEDSEFTDKILCKTQAYGHALASDALLDSIGMKKFYKEVK